MSASYGKSLDAVTTAVAGLAVASHGRRHISFQYKKDSGTLTAVNVKLQVRCYPGADWIDVPDAFLTSITGDAMILTTPYPVLDARLNIASRTGTGPVTGWIYFA
jgi:hypothetical protein